jgi:predicted metal-binding membrane protein
MEAVVAVAPSATDVAMHSLVLRQFSSSPRLIAWGCLAAITAMAWTFLLWRGGESLIQFLCIPYGTDLSKGDALPVLGMWAAMVLAMMLPSAAPMISTYLDISDAAHAKGMRVVPVMVLAGGYALAWLGFAAVATIVQIGASAGDVLTWPGIAGLLLVVAGSYQFSNITHACLTKCRNPMQYFLARWSDQPTQVFRQGLEQGLLCIGCCWTVMLLALVAGLMHPVWMAAAALLAILEKLLPQPKALIYGTGAGFIAAGFAMLFLNLESFHAVW